MNFSIKEIGVYFIAGLKKMILGQKTAFLSPKGATLGKRGYEMVCPAAKRLPIRGTVKNYLVDFVR